MYLEGVKDGRRFFRVLKEVARQKPVVIWKGGRTEEGGRAIASHTGSLAVPLAIWDAAVRQCGVVKVARMEELIDTLKALLYLKPVYGNRVAVTGGSGGQSVAIADVLAEAGLRLPQLSAESYAEFATFFTLIGGGYRNPVDTGNVNRRQMVRILDILERDTNTENIVLLLTARAGYALMPVETLINAVAEMKQKTTKPVLAIVSSSSSPADGQVAGDLMQKLQAGGVPTFMGLERGAQALKNALEYYRLKNGGQ
jgi:acyl-CoA synthetase (NDP forming)